jgi:Ni,Fe-hydrogenase I large subunit
VADQQAASRIARILARSGSDNPHEAAAALKGAYDRMKRDQVTLFDLLELPEQELYQDSLVKLSDLIVKDMTDLSPSARRDTYARYFALINAKFSPEASTAGQSSGGQGSAGSEQDREAEKRREAERKESQAREEAERWAREEAERRRERSKEDSRTSFREEPVRSQESKAGNTSKWEYTFRGYVFSFSPADAFAYLKTVVEPGSLARCAWEKPLRAFRLMAVCTLFGMAFAVSVLVILGVIHAFLGKGPLFDVRLSNAFSFLTAVGIFGKARSLHRKGWFRF